MNQGATSAEEIRARIADADPALLRFMDDCKRLFGAKLVAIRCPGLERGWAAWEQIKANAIPWEGPAKYDGGKEWKRIKEAAFGPRRGPGARVRKGLR